MASGSCEKALTILKSTTRRTVNELKWIYTPTAEITKIVRKMENKKSFGYDEFPVSILKENIDILAKPLAHFYNLCFSQGLFPEQLKIEFCQYTRRAVSWIRIITGQSHFCLRYPKYLKS